jgi:hypothetical protein
MPPAPLPPTEHERLAALQQYAILDTPSEEEFDELVRLAGTICNAPIALISLIDHERQWFKARVGLDVAETHRDHSFCAHALAEPDALLVVPSAADDPRFAANPLVTGDPHIRFYAGSPLVTPHGHALGTLCVIDRTPRNLSPLQREARTPPTRRSPRSPTSPLGCRPRRPRAPRRPFWPQ